MNEPIDFNSKNESHKFKMQKIKLASINMPIKSLYLMDDFQLEMIKKVMNKLKPNQWLHVSASGKIDKLNTDEIDNTTSKGNFIAKPNGLWLSKGDWISPKKYDSDAHYIATVDYSKIKVVSTLEDMFEFIKKYANRRIVDRKQFNFRLLQNEGYHGICFIPEPSYFLQKLYDKKLIKQGVANGLRGYDVSSLIIWNINGVIKSFKYIDYDDLIS